MSPRPKDPVRPEVKYVLDRIKIAIRGLGLSVRDIEKRLGYSFGYLSRVFSGNIELKMEHIVDIARSLEMDPEELLAFVYPTLKEPASPTVYQLWHAVGGIPPTATFMIRKMDDRDGVTKEEDLERALRRTLGNVLGDLAAHLTKAAEEE